MSEEVDQSQLFPRSETPDSKSSKRIEMRMEEARRKEEDRKKEEVEIEEKKREEELRKEQERQRQEKEEKEREEREREREAEERERLLKEKEERERLQREAEEREKQEREKEERERLLREKEEKERLLRETEARERLLKEREERERLQREERERLQKEKEEKDKEELKRKSSATPSLSPEFLSQFDDWNDVTTPKDSTPAKKSSRPSLGTQSTASKKTTTPRVPRKKASSFPRPSPTPHRTKTPSKTQPPTAPNDPPLTRNHLTNFIQMVKSGDYGHVISSHPPTPTDSPRVPFRDFDHNTQQQESLREQVDLLSQTNQSLLEELQETKAKANEFQDELTNIKKDKFVAQLHENYSHYRQRITHGGKLIDEIASKEDLERIEKEIKEQELLLAGFQRENEKLVEEAKEAQKKRKETEQMMFQENQKLKQEVILLRDECHQKTLELKAKTTDVQRIFNLEKELEVEKENQVRLREEISQLKKQKTSPGKDNLQEEMEKQMQRASQEHKREVMALQSRMREWEGTGKALQISQRRIVELEGQLEQLGTSEKTNALSSQRETKRVKELEARIREIESLLQSKTEESERWKAKVKMLETSGVRTPRQQKETSDFHVEKIRNQFTQKIKDLETKLRDAEAKLQNRPVVSGNVKKNKVTLKESSSDSLKIRELQEALAKKEEELFLLQQDFQSKTTDSSRIEIHSREVKEHHERYVRLQEQYDKLLQDKRSPNQLGRELESLKRRMETLQSENSQLQMKLETSEEIRKELQDKANEMLLQTHQDSLEKIRQIKSLQGKEMQSILKEYQSRMDNFRTQTFSFNNEPILALQKELQEAHAKITKQKERIRNLKSFGKNTNGVQERQRVEGLQKALDNSQYVVGQLRQKIHLLEIEKENQEMQREMIDDLSSRLRMASDEASSLREKIRLLEIQVQESPGGKEDNLYLLESKISEIEMHYKRRENELASMLRSLQDTLTAERKRHQQTVRDKNREIEKFRMELDDLLDAMLELQNHQKETLGLHKKTNGKPILKDGMRCDVADLQLGSKALNLIGQ